MKHWILNKLLKYLFNAVTEDDILVYRAGQLWKGKKPLSGIEVEELVSGAQTLQTMKVWQQMIKELQWVANNKIYNESVTTADLTFPKAMLYTLDVLQKKITNLSQLK